MEGAKFVMRTDCKPLLGVMHMKNPKNRQWKWAQYISQFNGTPQFVKCSENVMADFLSYIDELDDNFKIPKLKTQQE